MNKEIHYHDLQTIEDKIAHMLYAAKLNGIYGKEIVNAVAAYGDGTVQRALELLRQDEE